MLYKNAHGKTIFIFLNVIIFLKIGCANSDAAPNSPLLPYNKINQCNTIFALVALLDGNWEEGWEPF